MTTSSDAAYRPASGASRLKHAVTRESGKHCFVLCHGIAIVCAVCGFGLIVLASLDWVIYGIVLFGAAIALDVIVAAHCPDSPVYARKWSHPRVANVHVRKRSLVKR